MISYRSKNTQEKKGTPKIPDPIFQHKPRLPNEIYPLPNQNNPTKLNQNSTYQTKFTQPNIITVPAYQIQPTNPNLPS